MGIYVNLTFEDAERIPLANVSIDHATGGRYGGDVSTAATDQDKVILPKNKVTSERRAKREKP